MGIELKCQNVHPDPDPSASWLSVFLVIPVIAVKVAVKQNKNIGNAFIMDEHQVLLWFMSFTKISYVKLFNMCFIILSLFRNKRFMLDKMFQWNASKFAILLEYENLHIFVLFFILSYFIFSPNECRGLCWRRPRHLLREKIK